MLNLFVLACALSNAQASDDHWTMADTGLGILLPDGWQVPEGGWSDWSLKAKHSDGSVLQLWVTPFQVPVDDASVAAWADMYQKQIASEVKGTVAVRSKSLTKIGDRTAGHVVLDLTVKGGEGVAEVLSFEGPGHTVHARVVTGKRKAKKATAALRSILEGARVDQGPLALTTGTLASKEGDFSVTLPEGWRAPLKSEGDEITKIVEKLGMEAVDDSVCVVGLYPRANANPDLTLICPSAVQLDPLDEYSFDAIEAQLHEKFFGSAKTEVPRGEAVSIGDRLGVYFRPPTGTGALRLALAPYDRGMLTWWGIGGVDGTTLDAALVRMQPTVQYTGPEGGQPKIRADRWISHYVTHRPTSPLVLGPLVLLIGLIGAGVSASRRRKNPYEDID
ncbi:MAG TPA: hypothetical protein DFR83_09930 [Deltaproteobacteria bacterium]|nr:hypothetical protein [Deltaproteobacteria bacterium]